jgi:hypothetical protein
MFPLLKTDRKRIIVELTIVVLLAEVWLWSSPSAVFYRAIAAVAIACIVGSRVVRRDEDSWNLAGLWDARSTWIAALALTSLLAAGMFLGMLAFYTEGEQWRLWRLERIVEPKVFADKVFIVALQQVLLCWYLLPALRKITGINTAALAATAVTFGSFHLPNLMLASVTAATAVAWLLIFERGRRLSPIIVSHFILAITAAAVLPERLSYDLAVGWKALPIAERYQRLGEGRLAEDYKEWKSDAYYARNGGSDRAFILALYRDVLRRPASISEVENWVRALQRSSRADAVARFIDSKEYSALRCKTQGACE